MASVVERKTGAGERRLYVVFTAKRRSDDPRGRWKAGDTRKTWELVRGGKKEAGARKSAIEAGLWKNGGWWPLEPDAEPVDAPIDGASRTRASHLPAARAGLGCPVLPTASVTERRTTECGGFLRLRSPATSPPTCRTGRSVVDGAFRRFGGDGRKHEKSPRWRGFS
jgi:hypothetical protein